MTAKDFKGLKVRDLYQKEVQIIEITGNTATTSGGRYHIDKLFYEGKSIYNHINS